LRKSGDEIDQIDQEVGAIDNNHKEISASIEKMENSLNQAMDKGSKSAIEKLIRESEELREDLENIEKQFKEIQRLIDVAETEERVEQNNRNGLNEQAQTAAREITDIEVQRPQHEALIAQLTTDIAEMDAKVSQLSEELEDLRQTKDGIHDKITKCEVQRSKSDQDLIHLGEQRNERKVNLSHLQDELAMLKADIEKLLAEHPDFQPPSSGTVEQLKHQVERLEKRMRALEPVNMK